MNSKSQLERALRNLASFDIHRYLMANTHGRQDGFEKAQRHSDLCITFVSVILDIPMEMVRREDYEEQYQNVHTATQKLTSHMDEEIGFPLKSQPDYYELEPKFFNKFYALARKALAGKK